MKTSFTILILFVSVSSLFGQNNAPVAVNDTVWGYAGYPVYLNLLKNDLDPDGDSIYVYHDFGLNQINDSTWTFSIPAGPLDNYRTFVYMSIYVIKDEHDSIGIGHFFIGLKAPVLYDFLDVNNIKALISPFGQHFWDFDSARFEVPKGSGKNSLFSNTLWIGGIDENNQMHVAAERYRSEGHDYASGPAGGTCDSNFQKKWCNNWKVSKDDIRYHINNYFQPGYKAIKAIETWPAHGDIAVGQQKNYAPYYDANHNNIYDPYNGDYPLIRGDQAIFFIMNDFRFIHTESKSSQLNVEITGMAYAFDKPEDSTLNNSIFFHYEILNCSDTTYYDTYLGLYTDFDLGYPLDDYLGSDVTNGLLYGYNGHSVDGSGQPWAYGDHPPAVGLKLIGGPYLEPDGIDNPNGNCDESINGLNFGDGVADNERMGLSASMIKGWSYMNMYGDILFFPYTAMQGYINGDQNHLMYSASDSYTGVGPQCNYVYPGNSDTLCNWGTNGLMPGGGYNQNGTYWTESAVGNPPKDKQGLASVGPFTFAPKQTIPLDYCFTWARDYNGDNISSAELLRDRIAALAPSWNTLITAPITYFGVPDNLQSANLTVYPNPIRDKATVVFEGTSPQPYQLFSINGEHLSQGTLKPGSNLLDISTLKPGVYILKSGSYNARVVKM